MDKNSFQKLLFKYTLMLIIAYFIQTVWGQTYLYLYPTLTEMILNLQYTYKNILLYIIPYSVYYFFNLIFAIMIYKDLKRNKIRSLLTVIITFLFGFIGIGLFFIQLLYKLKIQKTLGNSA
jgi:hypothetical protein